MLLILLLAAAGQTTISERRPADVDDVRLIVDPLATAAAPEEALLGVPGVALARDGGPLSPARPVVRGLSGSRLEVNVLGLPFGDPAAGAVDAGLLPWSLGVVDVDVGAAGSGAAGGNGALGGSLSLLRPAPGLEAFAAFGELSTLLVQGRLVQPTEDGVVGVAGSLATSRGDFLFRADDALGLEGPLLRRGNNHQQRAGSAAFGVMRVDDVTLRGAGVIALHEGGIPGFATAPFETLRGRRVLGSAGLGFNWRGPVVVDVAGSVQGSERASTLGSFSDDDASFLFGTRAAVRSSVKAFVFEGFTVEGGVDVVSAAIPGVVDRHEGAVFAALRGRAPLGSLVGRVDAEGAVRGVDDVAVVLPTGSLRLGLADSPGHLLGFVGVTRAARAPTLDERFAPEGFVLGNPALAPESATEVEAGVVVAAGGVAVRVVGHASVVDDAIVIVNRSAFAVVPENTGPARRVGVDLGARIAPTETVSFDVSAALLGSNVDATRAPLPGAPAMLLRLRSRVGDEQLHVDVTATSRGASASTIFGTLVSPGFTLVDVTVRLPLAPNLGLGLSMHNALDVLNARDTNLLPLPGRLFFVSLQVKA
ncbi:MAG: TonB-dependent receptor [Deltaproteobacteria bacterium]|nr:TonB-dependent receptor [Deltaproteobacteria bacterium]